MFVARHLAASASQQQPLRRIASAHLYCQAQTQLRPHYALLGWATTAFQGRRRWLHARHAKGIACVFNTTGLHLSPVIGLLLHNTRALDSLWAEGEADGPPVARLARALFNRHDPTEPLQPCRNKSQAAAHLTPRLQGACLGLALRAPDASDATVRTSLIEREGVDVLARQSKVSIARFERLVALVAEAARQRRPLTLGTDTEEHAVAGVERAVQGRDDRVSAHGGGAAGAGGSTVGISGIDVFLAFVWASATSKRDVVDFLRALQSYVDDTAEATGDAPRLFAPSGDADAALRPLGDELEAAAFGAEVQYMLGGGSRSIAPDAAELEALETGGVAGAALERLAFTLVARHGCAPEVPQAVYGFRDQPAVADCVEAASARRSVSLCGTAAVAHTTPRCCRPRRTRASSTSSLAATTTAATALGGAGTSYSARAGRRSTICWARTPRTRTSSSLRSTTLQRPLHASSASRWCHRLQRVRSTKAATAAAAALAGTLAEEAPPLVPVWPGSPLRWQLLGDGRHPILLFRRVADAPERTGGDGGHAAEEMRVVFNGQRHCYSLRDGTRTTPAWVGALRRSWRRRVRRGETLHPATHAAAARLLGLHGPCTLARHEALHLEAEALAARPASPGAL